MAKNRERLEGLSLPEPMIMGLEKLALVLFWGGLLVMLGATGLMVVNYSRGAGVPEAEVIRNMNLFAPAGFYAAIAVGLGAAYLYWGEEILGPLLLIAAGAFLFAPGYVPIIIPTPPTNPELILESISKVGYALGAVGLFCLVWDVVSRVHLRVVQGAKADQLKYGRGIREEQDIRNVFLGKCWQLPYCRKFVRERCPIYHSRRTCWKERVGCMCEEQVIRNAMEGKVIPRDMVAAAKFIPYNSRLSPAQKAERCQQCVIYNEHQKHKYKTAIPVALISVCALYFITRQQASVLVLGLITATNQFISKATFDAVKADAATKSMPSVGGIMLHEIFTVVLFFILAVYTIRVIEHLFFRLKA
jgi:hypothetical protein